MQKTIAFGVASLVLLTPLFASAANCGTNVGGLENPIGYCTLYDFLNALLKVVIAIAFPVIVLFIVFIGFKYIGAQGKPDELSKVHKLFFWALVGSLIVLGAQALSLAIQATVTNLQQGI